jgi:eukaryotic-like serine/threonine-protein kinase
MPVDTPVPPLPFGVSEVQRQLGRADSVLPIGAGTFGVTLRVTRAGQDEALKVIHLQGIKEFRWKRELGALQAINSPHVVKYRSSGELTFNGDRYPYLAMEFIAGGNLWQRHLTNARPRSATEFRSLATGLLRGLHAMHVADVVHRDLKPQNICMRDAGWAAPVVVDLGMAKLGSMATETAYPAQLGTREFMSPEQLRGERATQRSDLFGIGVVLYVAASGAHPFIERSMTIPDLLQRMAKGPIKPLGALSGIVDARASATVTRMLSYRPADRLSVELTLADFGGP